MMQWDVMWDCLLEQEWWQEAELLHFYKRFAYFLMFSGSRFANGADGFFPEKPAHWLKAYTVFHSLKLMKGLPLQGVCI